MLAIVTGFACLAGVCSYLITAAEMGHHYSNRAQPRRQAVRAALVTTMFFELLGLLLFWASPRLLG